MEGVEGFFEVRVRARRSGKAKSDGEFYSNSVLTLNTVNTVNKARKNQGYGCGGLY
jgi:hypothetical protein